MPLQSAPLVGAVVLVTGVLGVVVIEGVHLTHEVTTGTQLVGHGVVDVVVGVTTAVALDDVVV